MRDNILYVIDNDAKHSNIYKINLTTLKCDHVTNLRSGELYVSNSCIYTWDYPNESIYAYNEVTNNHFMIKNTLNYVFCMSDHYIYGVQSGIQSLKTNMLCAQSIHSVDTIINWCEYISGCFGNKYFSLRNLSDTRDEYIVSHYDMNS